MQAERTNVKHNLNRIYVNLINLWMLYHFIDKLENSLTKLTK